MLFSKYLFGHFPVVILAAMVLMAGAGCSPTINGTVAVNASDLEEAPVLLSISPTHGPVSGNFTVTIKGTGFVKDLTVEIAGIPCTSATVLDETSVTCVLPPMPAGIYDIVVIHPNKKSSKLEKIFTYDPAPTVTSINPTSGSGTGGTAVTIVGTDFDKKATVIIGGAACADVQWTSATEISCTTAAAVSTGTVDVVVMNPDLQTGTLAAGFTYPGPVAVTSVSPTSGKLAGGALLTVNGTGFATGATVTLGGSSCTPVTFVSSTQVKCSTPVKTAGTYDVQVTNADTQSGTLSSAYTYNPLPTFTSITPSTGPGMGGTSVTIVGTGFLSGVGVTIGGTACSSVTLTGATQIQCTTGTGTGGARDVVITNTDTQSVTATGAYTYIPAPQISNISPTNGKLAGGGTLTVNGASFVSGATVTIGGVTCGSVNFVSSSQLTCTIPSASANSLAAGSYAVKVTNPDTQYYSLTNGYTYNANHVPTLTSISTLTGATEDTSYTISYSDLSTASNAADEDSDAISFRIEAVSTGALTKGGSPVTPGTTTLATGESVVWTPAANSNGDLNAFTVKAWDGAAASASAIQVKVNATAVDDAPTLTAISTLADGLENTAYTVTYAALLAASDAADLESATVQFRIEAVSTGTLTKGGSAVTAGVTTLGTGESLVWTPATEASGDLNAFTVKAWDGTNASSSAVQVKVAVTGVNSAPVAVNTSASTSTEVAVDIDVVALTTDTDNTPAELTPSIISAPSHGTASIVSGVIRYTPEAGYPVSPAVSGTDTFTYKVTDAGGAQSETKTVTVDVSVCGGAYLTNSPFANSPAAGGTSEADAYIICTTTQYNQISNSASYVGKYFKLAKDLDFDGVGINMIGDSTNKFSGTFDGTGHALKNVTLTVTASYAGIFRYINTGKVKNLSVIYKTGTTNGGSTYDYIGGLAGFVTGAGALIDNCSVSGTATIRGQNNTGGLVGQMESTGTITNSRVSVGVQGWGNVGGLVGLNSGPISTSYVTSGSVSANYNVGGFVGVSNGGTISKVFSTANVSANGTAGGLIGSLGSGTVDNCYARGNVTSTGSAYTGGLIGSSYVNVKNCYATGVVGGSTARGGLIADGYSSIASYWDKNTTTMNTSVGGGAPLTTAKMQDQSSFMAGGWNFNTTWRMPSEGGYPILQFVQPRDAVVISSLFAGGDGTSASPYLISTVQQLKNVAYAMQLESSTRSAYYKLTSDIDLGTGGTPVIGFWDSYASAAVAFAGTFDGDNHLISNVDIAGVSNYTGLFGYVDNGKIKNLSVSLASGGGVKCGSFDYCGGAVGYIKTATSLIDRVSVSGPGTVTGQSYLGGLVGSIETAALPVTNSFATVTVTGNSSSQAVGGLAGKNLGSISGCYSTGSVYGWTQVGGLVGNNASSISTSYSSTGTVSCGSGVAGGLVGYNSGGTVSQVFSTMNVTGPSQLGGLVGNLSSGELNNCYARGNVTASGYNLTGGLVGTNSSSFIKYCYSTGTASGAQYDNGGFTGGGNSAYSVASYWDETTSNTTSSTSGTRLVTAKLQDRATFLAGAWNFDTIWRMPEGGGYPILQFTQPRDAVVISSLFAGGDGTSGSPYLISTAQQLKDIAYAMLLNSGARSAYYKLTNDIDLGSGGTPIIGVWDTLTASAVYAFTGVFDGDSHQISNVNLVGVANYTGLFGYVNGGQIKNLRIALAAGGGVKCGTFDYCGGVVSYIKGAAALIDDVSISGPGTVSGRSYLGGVVGAIDTGGLNVTDSFATVTVTGDSSSQYVGGFAGKNAGSIARCYSTGSVSGWTNVAGLVGNNMSNISNSYSSTGSVSGGGSGVGGLIGYNGSGTVSQVFSTMNVTGNAQVGGLIGSLSGGTEVNNCFARGNATASGYNLTGGLVGNNGGVAIKYCYSTGTASGAQYDNGGFTGGGSAGYVTASFWDDDTSANTTSTSGIALTTGQMQDRATFVAGAWNFNTIWRMPDGGGYPILQFIQPRDSVTIASLFAGGDGTSGTPYLVSSAQQFKDIAYAIQIDSTSAAKYYRLTTNIDLAGGGTPMIGNASTSFTGTFEGGGYQISNLKLAGTAQKTGLFGTVGANGVIKNLTITLASGSGINCTGIDYCGALAGSIGGSNALIDNVTVNGPGTVVGQNYVGGLVGQIEAGATVSYSVVNVNVSSNSNGNYVGGLTSKNAGTVTWSSSTGNVSGWSNIGGLIGYSNGTVTACYTTTGAVTGGSNSVGGLIGDNVGNVSLTYSTMNVTGSHIVGGLIGSMGSGSVKNSYARGNATATGTYSGTVGGLVGSANATVERCYSTGAVSGYAPGGLTSSGYDAYSSFWDSQTGYATSDTGVGLTTAKAQDRATYLAGNWNFDTVWRMPDGGGYPILQIQQARDAVTTASLFAGGDGTSGSPYLISTIQQLKDIAYAMQLDASAQTAYYQLTDNLDLGTGGTPMFGMVDPVTGVIDASSRPFKGVFDGGGFTISNVSIAAVSGYSGLFGYVNAGQIKNLSITLANGGGVKCGGSYSYCGGLVGYINGAGSLLENVAVSGTGTVTGNNYTGGLAGNIEASVNVSGSTAGVGVTCASNYCGGFVGSTNGLITTSSATGSVAGYGYVGGFAGRNFNSGSITSSFSTTGTVAGTTNNTGGFLGENQGTLSKVYSTRNATGQNYVGGLIGVNNSGSVTNSYATGNATVTGSTVGGLIGLNYSTVTNCYSTGKPTGSTAGGLTGSGNNVTASFWDTETSTIGTSGGGTGKTTAQMKDTDANTDGIIDTFAAWSTAIWNLAPGAYPTLK